MEMAKFIHFSYSFKLINEKQRLEFNVPHGSQNSSERTNAVNNCQHTNSLSLSLSLSQPIDFRFKMFKLYLVYSSKSTLLEFSIRIKNRKN